MLRDCFPNSTAAVNTSWKGSRLIQFPVRLKEFYYVAQCTQLIRLCVEDFVNMCVFIPGCNCPLNQVYYYYCKCTNTTVSVLRLGINEKTSLT